jgi:hypothetical protein
LGRAEIAAYVDAMANPHEDVSALTDGLDRHDRPVAVVVDEIGTGHDRQPFGGELLGSDGHHIVGAHHDESRDRADYRGAKADHAKRDARCHPKGARPHTDLAGIHVVYTNRGLAAPPELA